MTSLRLVRHIKARPQVEITLRATGDGTDLSFTHSKLHDEESSRGHEQGWAGSLRKLEAYMAKGEAA